MIGSSNIEGKSLDEESRQNAMSSKSDQNEELMPDLRKPKTPENDIHKKAKKKDLLT